MPFCHLNNRVFDKAIPPRIALSILPNDLPVVYSNTAPLSSSISISRKPSINSGMMLSSTNFTAYQTHLNRWFVSSNIFAIANALSRWTNWHLRWSRSEKAFRKALFSARFFFFSVILSYSLQSLLSASHCHLLADDLAVVVHASTWWHRTQFASQMANLGQEVLHEIDR